MKPRRKLLTVEVTVSAPPQMSASAIRRELRYMRGGWSFLGDEIKIRGVRPAKRAG